MVLDLAWVRGRLGLALGLGLGLGLGFLILPWSASSSSKVRLPSSSRPARMAHISSWVVWGTLSVASDLLVHWKERSCPGLGLG